MSASGGHTTHPETTSHRLGSMTGRNPGEAHRAASPLELLYDLTFVIGFGAASAQLAHFLAEGHFAASILAFVIVMLAICWAWVNFSWFSSAYDTDDWAFRLATLVQMVGVAVMSLGIPRAFAGIEHAHFDNSVMVLGYVIMRLAMVFLWLRAAKQDPQRRRTCLAYAAVVFIAQAGWVALLLAAPEWQVAVWILAALFVFELAAPVIPEILVGEGGTPWHAHHIAERYSLLTIISLGESVFGTVASVSAIVEENGWSAEAIMLCFAGMGLTFGIWWVYFLLPAAPVLHRFRNRAYVWAYLHIILFASIAATGAGLHVVGYFIEHKAEIGAAAAITSVVIPVGLVILSIFAICVSLFRGTYALRAVLLAISAMVLAAAVTLVLFGASLTLALAVLTLAPAVTVIGYEVFGYGQTHEAILRELGNG